MLDDFELGNTSPWVIFKDSSSSLNAYAYSPGATGVYAMKVDYQVAVEGWAGVQRLFGSAQDWSLYTHFSFQIYGNRTGNMIRLELLDDRAPGSGNDTFERFEYLIVDNFSGWQMMNLSWGDFTRRNDWQPTAAPNNGLTRSQVWGYDFAPISGSGSFLIDQNALVSATTLSPTPTPQPTSTSVSSSLLIDDFESGSASLWSIFSDENSNVTERVILPGQAGQFALQLDAAIGVNGWGGAQRLFASPQDWLPFGHLNVWLCGDNTQNPWRIEILDNCQPGSSTDTSERFEYRFTDNWNGWRLFALPWADFSRRSDWQPTGAPNDGFTRTQVWGMNFALVGGSDRLLMDQLALTTP